MAVQNTLTYYKLRLKPTINNKQQLSKVINDDSITNDIAAIGVQIIMYLPTALVENDNGII